MVRANNSADPTVVYRNNRRDSKTPSHGEREYKFQVE